MQSPSASVIAFSCHLTHFLFHCSYIQTLTDLMDGKKHGQTMVGKNLT